VEGTVWLTGPGEVVIGNRVRLLARRAPIELRAHAGGLIRLEDDAVIEAGVSIEATRFVRVGRHARIGPFCKVIDNDFHRTTGDRAQRPDPVPVVVGEGAAVGPRAILLPGTVLGARSMIAAGRVVSSRVPSMRFG
jgi:acetyltransferase-like isoleucine patch superfamily enzyme